MVGLYHVAYVDRQTNRLSGRQIDIDRQADRHRQTVKQTDRQSVRQTDRQTDRQTERHRQTDTHTDTDRWTSGDDQNIARLVPVENVFEFVFL